MKEEKKERNEMKEEGREGKKAKPLKKVDMIQFIAFCLAKYYRGRPCYINLEKNPSGNSLGPWQVSFHIHPEVSLPFPPSPLPPTSPQTYLH